MCEYKAELDREYQQKPREQERQLEQQIAKENRDYMRSQRECTKYLEYLDWYNYTNSIEQHIVSVNEDYLDQQLYTHNKMHELIEENLGQLKLQKDNEQLEKTISEEH